MLQFMGLQTVGHDLRDGTTITIDMLLLLLRSRFSRVRLCATP